MRWSSRVPGEPPQGPVLTARVLSPSLSLDQGVSPVFRKHFAMGSVFEIATYGTNPSQASQAIDHAFQEIDRLEQVMSIYKPASELSRLNRTAHVEAQTVSQDLYQVIQESLHYSELSEGAFDVTVGPLAATVESRGPRRASSQSGRARKTSQRCGLSPG